MDERTAILIALKSIHERQGYVTMGDLMEFFGHEPTEEELETELEITETGFEILSAIDKDESTAIN